MDYEHVIADVIAGWFLRALAIFAAYKFGVHCSSIYKQKWKIYFAVTGCTLLLTLIAWGNYGRVFEDEDSAYEVVDFVPRDKERNERALAFFLALTIPALVGVHKGKEHSDWNIHEHEDPSDR
ncbi:MAG: hypothetical protein A3H27_12125 [Acidobacteria bacterium RIFCSPLOWO2_02_FULL_59_13]|nr:MAG: hypothetical protein A3H27_12125 [Acidobacteria bacterium RIFCSPLOWO2_02_FULL_59_13]